MLKPSLRNPDDPAFDPKNEFMDLVWLAFRGWDLEDLEEARLVTTSPELKAFFIELGFSPRVAGRISDAVVQYCVDLLPKRKRGRPPRPPWHNVVLQARRLAGLKEELRASGQKGSVHKKAMQLLQAEHEQVCKELNLPPQSSRFDYDAIEHYVRRTKRRSTK